jgi:GMP synthase-like glutamine amidotransferase
MIAVIQNDPEVPFGSYALHLRQRAIDFTVVTPYTGDSLPSVQNIRAAIILGGAMGAHDDDLHPFLREVKVFLAAALALNVPLLGICLGGQLLADVLGAHVASPSSHSEKGMVSISLTEEGTKDHLFSGITGGFPTFQWHNDSFALPAGAIRLAFSEQCPQQAFRYANAYGLQFHPEVDEEILVSWATSAHESPETINRLLADYRNNFSAYSLVSRLIMDNFLSTALC